MSQVGRDLGRVVVQSPAQNRVSYKVRPSWSEFNPVGYWKTPRMETAQPLWVVFSSAWLSSWGIQSELLAFQLMPVVSSSFDAPLINLALLSWWNSHKYVGAALRLPQSCPFSSSFILSSQSTYSSSGPAVLKPTLSTSFFYRGAQNWT